MNFATNLPFVGKFLKIAGSAVSIGAKAVGGAAADKNACRKKWNFKTFKMWKELK